MDDRLVSINQLNCAFDTTATVVDHWPVASDQWPSGLILAHRCELIQYLKVISYGIKHDFDITLQQAHNYTIVLESIELKRNELNLF